jgi:hypothetical protein
MGNQPQKRARIDTGEPKNTRKQNAKSVPLTPTPNPTSNPVWNNTINNPTPTWDQINTHLQLKLEENNLAIRTEMQEYHVEQRKRISDIDRRVGNLNTIISGQYDFLTDMGKQNKDEMTDRFNRLEDLFANLMTPNTTENKQNQSEIFAPPQQLLEEQSMDLSFHREESLI